MAKLGKLDPCLLRAVTVTSYIASGIKLKMVVLFLSGATVSSRTFDFCGAELSVGSIKWASKDLKAFKTT